MQKSVLEAVINNLKSIGIENYLLYCRGGNIQLIHDKVTGVITLKDEYIVYTHLSSSWDNYSENGQFSIEIVPYEDINYLEINHVSMKNTFEVVGAFEAKDDNFGEFIKQVPIRHGLNTNSKKMDEGYLVNGKGEKVKPIGMPGYVVRD